MISFKHNFIFIHVPKTGGNSIQTLLKHYSGDTIVTHDGKHDGLNRFEVRNHHFKTTKHSRLADYSYTLGASQVDDMFRFATIRNPWDRMISYYFSPHRSPTGAWDRDEFIELVNRVHPVRTYIDGPLDGLGSNLNYLMRFENLQSDFEVVCNKLDLPRMGLPKVNISDRGPYQNYYDNETRELVARKFADEIEYGDYGYWVG